HAVGQLVLNFVEPGFDALGDGAAVLARQHHRRSDDRFMSVERRCAGAKFCAKFHLGHILDEKWLYSRTEFEWQVFDFLRVADAADGANGELFRATADDTATRVLNVLRDEV